MQDEAKPTDTAPSQKRDTPEDADTAQEPERRVRPRETPVGPAAAAAPEPEEGASAEAQSEDSNNGDDADEARGRHGRPRGTRPRTTRRALSLQRRRVPRCGTGRFGTARPTETRVPTHSLPYGGSRPLGLPLTTTRLRTRGSGRSSKWRPDAWSTRRRSRASPPDTESRALPSVLTTP